MSTTMFGIELPVIWFVVIAVLFTGYFLLEGFDFGVGILAPFIGKNRAERNTVVGTIGPVWDGNEVWLITAGGALFAAFPEWYATMFSGFYIPLFVILIALIVRVVALEWRKKVTDPVWERWCDAGLAFGSWAPALLWGLTLATLVGGLPLDAEHHLDAGAALAHAVNPYALLGAVAFTAVFVAHGLAFIRLKTTGIVRRRAAKFVLPCGILATVTAGAFVVWTVLAAGGPGRAWALGGLAVAALLAAVTAMTAGRDRVAFAASCAAVVAVSALVFSLLFPAVMPTTLAEGSALTVYNAASNPYTLRFLTWVGLVMAPLVVAYQGWTYWVFSRRLRAEDAAVEADPPHGADGPAR